MKNLTGIITVVLIVLALGFLVIQNCECCETKCSIEKTPPPPPPEKETVVDGEAIEEIANDSTDVDADTSEVVEDKIESTEK